MNVGKLIENMALEVVSEGDFSAAAEGCYCSDLLSHCMSNIKAKNIWVTVQTNINIIAIAVLTEPSCIIVAQNMKIEDSVIQKAKVEGITVLRSPEPAYELCVKIGSLI